jgi:hypothetical protein
MLPLEFESVQSFPTKLMTFSAGTRGKIAVPRSQAILNMMLVVWRTYKKLLGRLSSLYQLTVFPTG